MMDEEPTMFIEEAALEMEPSTKPAPEGAWGIGDAAIDTRIRRVKEGLPIEAFDHLAEALDIPAGRLADVVWIAPRTLARRRTEGRLQPDESERVMRLGMLLDRAIEVLGSRERASRWFQAPRRVLAGHTPLDYADTEIGAREVEELLGRLAHGVFS